MREVKKHYRTEERDNLVGYERGHIDGWNDCRTAALGGNRTVIGMSVQALAGEIVAAVVADEAGDGCDISAGMFGPEFSALIRRIVCDYLTVQHQDPKS